jgi:aspartyl/asparaginyl beta-hydroxylase (cupin superfamily)
VASARPEQTIQELMAAAGRALAAGDAAGARAILEAAVARHPGHAPAWLNLAAATRAQGDLDAAMAALEAALRLEPRNFYALLGKAAVLERQGHARPAAVAYGVALSQAPPDERLDPGTGAALQHGRELNGRHVAELEAFLRAALRGALDDAPDPAARRADTFIDLALRKQPNYRQEPVEFFWPGLPAIPFYERELFPWLADFEAATADMRDELIALIQADAGELVPYVAYPDGIPLDQWKELNHSLRWGAYHLMAYGERVEANCERVPKTMRAIGLLPQPQVPRRSPAAMFSVLQPRTRIPPHTGVANTRLVVHLPLIVPGDCGFRVGPETRAWREGEAWVFDDTIEHEAWNGSDERRVILICDVWSPFLSELDREVVTRVMTAMDEFNQTAPEADP